MTNAENMTDAEYAEWLFEHRDELEEGDPVEVELSPSLASVVSVRFKRDELAKIEQAAQKAGMPFTAYIREAALHASGLTDLKKARRELKTLHRVTEALGIALGESGNVVKKNLGHVRPRPSH